VLTLALFTLIATTPFLAMVGYLAFGGPVLAGQGACAL
jgi:hypothetical protein